MKNQLNQSVKPFHTLPEEGKFGFLQFFVTIVLFLSVFVGIGQIPLVFALFNKVLDQGEMDNLNYDAMSTLLGSNWFLTLMIIPFGFGLLALILGIKYIHGTSVLAFFTSRASFDWKRVFLSLGIWGGFMTLMLVYSYFNSDTFVWNYHPFNFWMLALICLFLLPLQSTCEELLFRSYLFKNMQLVAQPMVRVLICGTLFGLMHGANPEIEVLGRIALVFYIWNGIFLGLITHFDNGMELAVGYHAINNIFAALLVTNNWQALRTEALFIDTAAPVFGWDILLTMLVWQPLLFFFFKWKYKWNLKANL
jgi:uncharacterized protein